MEIWEHILIIFTFIVFVGIVKLMRGAEKFAEEQETENRELQTIEAQKIENHYHTHDNRTINIIVRDGNELKTVLSKKMNQTKFLGDQK